MQRNLILPILAAGMLCVPPAFAQNRQRNTETYSKQETVVIRDDRQRTVIELRDGRLYVNGDPVVTLSDQDAGRISKKIIIDHRSGDGGNDRREDIDREEVASERRAMLGVLSDQRDREGGALIREVTPGSPAEEAGLRAGDRILRVDDNRIDDAAALSREIGKGHRPGDKVTISYERNGRSRTATATLSAVSDNRGPRTFGFNDKEMTGMPENFFREFRFNEMSDDQPRLGVSVEDRSSGSGVVVRSVAPGSAAARAGIRTGDILLRVDKERISSAADLQERMRRSTPGEQISLEYERAGKTLTVKIAPVRPASRKDL